MRHNKKLAECKTLTLPYIWTSESLTRRDELDLPGEKSWQTLAEAKVFILANLCEFVPNWIHRRSIGKVCTPKVFPKIVFQSFYKESKFENVKILNSMERSKDV